MTIRIYIIWHLNLLLTIILRYNYINLRYQFEYTWSHLTQFSFVCIRNYTVKILRY